MTNEQLEQKEWLNGLDLETQKLVMADAMLFAMIRKTYGLCFWWEWPKKVQCLDDREREFSSVETWRKSVKERFNEKE